MKKNKKLDVLFIIVFGIAIFIIIYSANKILNINKEYKKVDNAYEEIVGIALEGKPNDQEEIKIDWEQLKKINPDIIAWITIKKTNINYPILKGKDNQKYIRHDIYGNYSIGGNPFVDCNIEKPFSDNNTILYGHNLNNGDMFANLKNFSNKEYLENNKDIEIYLTDNSKKKYTVFAYSKLQADNNIIYNTSVNNLEDYYNEIKQHSIIYIDNNLSYTKPILTLSTCTNNNKEERYVVHAYLNE